MTIPDPTTWVRRCADRLQDHWPRVPRDDLEDTALDLLGDTRWRRLGPEEAAVGWLQLGGITAASEGSSSRSN